MSRPEHDTQLPSSARADLEGEGYTAEFRVVEGGAVACPGCGEEREPEQLDVEAIARYEGVSDPDDEQSDLGVRCTVCDTRGILTTAYGPDASADEGEVLRRMNDVRQR